MRLLSINEANNNKHKYIATFELEPNKYKNVPFGAFGYSDFIQHGDKARKQRYLNRHRKNEDWSDPTTPGALSRFILWNKPTLEDSIKDFIKRFDI
jgi:hypothetical protein